MIPPTSRPAPDASADDPWSRAHEFPDMAPRISLAAVVVLGALVTLVFAAGVAVGAMW